MSKYQRAKLWVKRNQDPIITVGVFAVLGTAFVGLVVVGVKADAAYREQMNAELNAYIDQLNALHRSEILKPLNIKEILDAAEV